MTAIHLVLVALNLVVWGLIGILIHKVRRLEKAMDYDTRLSQRLAREIRERA